MLRAALWSFVSPRHRNVEVAALLRGHFTGTTLAGTLITRSTYVATRVSNTESDIAVYHNVRCACLFTSCEVIHELQLGLSRCSPSVIMQLVMPYGLPRLRRTANNEQRTQTRLRRTRRRTRVLARSREHKRVRANGDFRCSSLSGEAISGAISYMCTTGTRKHCMLDSEHPLCQLCFHLKQTEHEHIGVNALVPLSMAIAHGLYIAHGVRAKVQH